MRERDRRMSEKNYIPRYVTSITIHRISNLSIDKLMSIISMWQDDKDCFLSNKNCINRKKIQFFFRFSFCERNFCTHVESVFFLDEVEQARQFDFVEIYLKFLWWVWEWFRAGFVTGLENFGFLCEIWIEMWINFQIGWYWSIENFCQNR